MKDYYGKILFHKAKLTKEQIIQFMELDKVLVEDILTENPLPEQ